MTFFRPVPQEFGDLTNLEKFYVEHNKLYGFMPEEVCLLRDEEYGNLMKLGSNCNSYRTNTPPPSEAPTTLAPTRSELIRRDRHRRQLQEIPVRRVEFVRT